MALKGISESLAWSWRAAWFEKETAHGLSHRE
jgi:hypothetical protein